MSQIVSTVKSILHGTAITGGLTGLFASIVAIWVIVYWFMDECSFDTMKCKTPSNVDARDQQRNIMFVFAAVSTALALISIIFMVLSAGTGIKRIRHSHHHRR